MAAFNGQTHGRRLTIVDAATLDDEQFDALLISAGPRWSLAPAVIALAALGLVLLVVAG